MPIITPTWDENSGYTGDSPLAEGSGWSFDDSKGWYKWVPSTSPTLDAQAIDNLTPYNINTDTAPGESRFEINPNQPAATDPNAYYSQLSSDLATNIWKNNAENAGGRNTEYNNLLESIKDVNPAAYYNAQIQLLASEMGHASAMGETDRKTVAQQKLYALAPQAISAGVTPDQLNATANSSYSSGANYGQAIKNKAAAGSGFWKDNLIGALKVGALAMGAYGLDTALAAGAAGAEAGAAGSGGAFTPTAGSSFAIDPSATYTTAGFASNAAPLTTTEILGSSGFTPTGDASFAIDPSATYTSSIAPYAGDAQYEAQDVMQQARDTNVPSGSPTSWDTGTSFLPTTGLTDAAKLAKALTSSAGSKLSSATQNLATGQIGMGAEIPGIIRGNQNPFTYSPQQPIQDTKQAQLASLLKQG